MRRFDFRKLDSHGLQIMQKHPPGGKEKARKRNEGKQESPKLFDDASLGEKRKEGRETTRWYLRRISAGGGYQTASDLEARIKAKWRELKWLELRVREREKGKGALIRDPRGTNGKGRSKRRQFRKDLHSEVDVVVLVFVKWQLEALLRVQFLRSGNRFIPAAVYIGRLQTLSNTNTDFEVNILISIDKSFIKMELPSSSGTVHQQLQRICDKRFTVMNT